MHLDMNVSKSRDCSGVVHETKHSPQYLNILQDAAMSVTPPKRNAGLIEIGAFVFENI